MYNVKVIMNGNHTQQSQVTRQTGLFAFLKNDSYMNVLSLGWSQCLKDGQEGDWRDRTCEAGVDINPPNSSFLLVS